MRVTKTYLALLVGVPLLMVLLWTWGNSYQGRVDNIHNQRTACEKAKVVDAQSAQGWESNAFSWLSAHKLRKATLNNPSLTKDEHSDAQEAVVQYLKNSQTSHQTAHIFNLRSHRSCFESYPDPNVFAFPGA